MKYRADLHIHSKYSRATSKDSHLHGLAAWAVVKGIQVLGTGDFTHPGWFHHLTENLEEAEPGFFRLKTDGPESLGDLLPAGIVPDIRSTRFVLTAEISSIYKRHGKVRKIHNIVFAPNFQAAAKINTVLAGIGNLESDGRPILGLDSRDLLEIVLEHAPDGFLVPAHIWTPWFSLFGSKSGFDSLEECFGDLSPHVFALETGLSSDPDMNRCISALDSLTLISNSDCHSPSKIAREANILNTGFDYYSMRDALRSPVDAKGKQVFAATVEFYPEEGKYHCDGHRKCGICLDPEETAQNGGKCPACGKAVTVGVLNRVMELADRRKPFYAENAPAVHSLVPLAELLGEMLGTGPATKKVNQAYAKLIRQFGSELDLLLEVPLADIGDNASKILAEAIGRVRSGKVIRSPGYDGEFGVIKVFSDEEKRAFGGQLNLFGISPAAPRTTKKTRKNAAGPALQKIAQAPPAKKELNPGQRAVVESCAPILLVKAGPGTGKTFTLVQKVLADLEAAKRACTVITFTNKTASEVRDRLAAAAGALPPDVFVGTFHGFCLHWLRKKNGNLGVAGRDMRRWMLQSLFSEVTGAELDALEGVITTCFHTGTTQVSDDANHVQAYLDLLQRHDLIDIDSIIPAMTAYLGEEGETCGNIFHGIGKVYIDEFQDLNANQYELVHLLSQFVPIFAIGDPDQAIYGFRGSDPRFFYRFIEELHAEVHTLCRNYRSGKHILAAAQALINRESSRVPVPELEAAGDKTGHIYEQELESAEAEAAYIVRQIEEMLGGTSHIEIDRLSGQQEQIFALHEIGILYRTSRQAEVIANKLAQQGIPYQVVDLQPFYLAEPVRPLYHFLLAAAGEDTPDDFFALLAREKGVGGQTIKKLRKLVEPHIKGVLPVLLRHLDQGNLGETKLRPVLYSLRDNLERVLSKSREEGLVAALQDLLAFYDVTGENDDIGRFCRLAAGFGNNLAALIEHLQKYTDSVVYDDRAQAVTLMTLHASKGLEFPVVFITGVEEGLVPLQQRMTSDAEQEKGLAEERRLFFVGITRAIDRLYLTRVRQRSLFGQKQNRTRSRFLGDIPEELFSAPETLRKTKRKMNKAKQLSLF